MSYIKYRLDFQCINNRVKVIEKKTLSNRLQINCTTPKLDFSKGNILRNKTIRKTYENGEKS